MEYQIKAFGVNGAFFKYFKHLDWMFHDNFSVWMCLALFLIHVSQFTVETYCFADGRFLFKQLQSVIYHWNQYDEENSKKCSSIRPSVCPFVTLTRKAYSSFIIASRKISCISGERVWHSLQKNEAIFSKKCFLKILEGIFKKFCTCIKCRLFHYKPYNNNSHIRWKGLACSTRKWGDIFKNIYIFQKF